ncbi:MAG TPA: alpha/beta family hydrolase [Candidatus Eisenbacteria bacterium]|jgi:putative phosphoribosyl transferase
MTGESIVHIPACGATLEGALAVPERPAGIVLFAHGSGSSRHSRRNQFVAAALRDAGVGTLLFDLLAPEEDADDERRFDIPLLTRRLEAATEWLEASQPPTPLGYFGASTGAAAALAAAAGLGARIRAVVSRGGRPDLAADDLPRVRAATLLIVGARDEEVLELNRRALERLACERELIVVPGATHLFEEPGALEAVAEHAASWFARHLA